MREILFRGMRVDNGEWVYGNLNLFKDEAVGVYMIDCFDVIPETVGQYTGLTANGTKIFEGDIVKTDRFSKSNRLYIVKYDLRFSAFICQDKDNLYFVPFDGDSDQFEVIGNIHDNEELLEIGRGENEND